MSSLFYGTSFQTNQASTKTFSRFPTTQHCRKVVKVQRAATMGYQHTTMQTQNWKSKEKNIFHRFSYNNLYWLFILDYCWYMTIGKGKKYCYTDERMLEGCMLTACLCCSTRKVINLIIV